MDQGWHNLSRQFNETYFIRISSFELSKYHLCTLFCNYQFETVGLHMECSLILCVLLKSLTQAANQIQDLFQFNQGSIMQQSIQNRYNAPIPPLDNHTSTNHRQTPRGKPALMNANTAQFNIVPKTLPSAISIWISTWIIQHVNHSNRMQMRGCHLKSVLLAC